MQIKPTPYRMHSKTIFVSPTSRSPEKEHIFWEKKNRRTHEGSNWKEMSAMRYRRCKKSMLHIMQP
jgi:hypothetical protein